MGIEPRGVDQKAGWLPLNHTCSKLKSVARGDIYMDCYIQGFLASRVLYYAVAVKQRRLGCFRIFVGFVVQTPDFTSKSQFCVPGRIRVRVRLRCFVMTGGHKGVLCVRRGAASGLRLEGRLRSILTVMLGGDFDVATRV